MPDLVLNIDNDGTISFVHHDDLTEIVMLHSGEEPPLRRASHVEPDISGQWTADLSPVNGPLLGPFALRSEALAAEVSWLRDNGY